VCLCASSNGPGTLYECQITTSRSRYSTGNWNRLPGGPVRWYKVTLKINLKQCGINPNVLNSAALKTRSSWRSECHQAIEKLEETGVASLVCKRAAHKYGVHVMSESGRVTAALRSSTDSPTDDKQSVDLYGAVHGVPRGCTGQAQNN